MGSTPSARFFFILSRFLSFHHLTALLHSAEHIDITVTIDAHIEVWHDLGKINVELIQEGRGSEYTHETKLADHRGRGRQSTQWNDVDSQPTLNHTPNYRTDGEAENRERDGATKREVLLAQQQHRTKHGERQLKSRGVINSRGLWQSWLER